MATNLPGLLSTHLSFPLLPTLADPASLRSHGGRSGRGLREQTLVYLPPAVQMKRPRPRNTELNVIQQRSIVCRELSSPGPQTRGPQSRQVGLQGGALGACRSYSSG